MRIGYLVSQYPTVNHTFVFREVRGLRKLGFEVCVASIGATDRPLAKLLDDEREEHGRTYYIKPAGLGGALQAHLKSLLTRPASYLEGVMFAVRLGGFDLRKILYNLFYFVEAVMVGEWMRREDLRHVHIHFSSMVGLILSRMYPVTISITIHGPDEFNPSLPTGWCLAEKVQRSRFVCVISNFGRSQLMRVCADDQWEKIEVSPLGVDPSAYHPEGFLGQSKQIQILCVGRLVPVKAQRILLAAIDRVVRQDRDVRLRLVGDGPDRSALEREVVRRGLSNCVTFEGWLNQDQLRGVYQEADLFVLPSFAEGVPVVLMEAMAMGIPCIATWVAGIPELIRNEIDGLLVAPSDEAGLADAILRLMDDPSLRQHLGQSGRQRVLVKYDLIRNTARLANIFCHRLNEVGCMVSASEVGAANPMSVATTPVLSVVDSHK